MRILCALAALLLGAGSVRADELRDIYQELLEIDTTHDAGSTTKAAEAMAARLRAAGMPAADVQVFVPPGKPTKGNLVARLRGGGGGKKPVLPPRHLAAGEGRQEGRATQPHKPVEEEG